MSKTVVFFPGQGSQYVGMARDLYEEYPQVRPWYQLASEEIGEDIGRLSFEGPADKLQRTRFTQPAILLHSLAILTILKDRLPAFDYAAGHSLGEYGALALTGALTFEGAIKAVIHRASLMDTACQAHPSAMAAILGLGAEKVTDICSLAEGHGVVVPANYNSAAQVVISGEPRAVENVVSLAREAGAKRAVMLDVGGAFHSPLMESAGTGLQRYLASVTVREPVRPIIANVTAEPVTDPDRIRSLLARQVTAPVRWAETMQWLAADEVTTVIEIGPGKVLTTLARREMRPDAVVNLDTRADVEAFAAVTI